MGKGDKKTKRGKIWKGSFGNSRSRKKIKERISRGNLLSSTNKPEKQKKVAAPKKRKVAKKRAKKVSE